MLACRTCDVTNLGCNLKRGEPRLDWREPNEVLPVPLSNTTAQKDVVVGSRSVARDEVAWP
jgi:hypothetical protein